MSTHTPRSHRLITIGASHYCEKARWALDRLGVSYREEAHFPLVHWLFSYGAGGGRTVPVLVTPAGEVLRDSTAILLHLDARYGVGSDWRPYPAERELRGQVLALEDHFDEALGPYTRRLVYAHLLDTPELLTPGPELGLAPWERQLVRGAGPLLRALLRRGVGAVPARLPRALERVDNAFAEVGKRVGDGGYLVGDRFTAADLTFAALSAPLLFPPTYGSNWLPALDVLPAGLRELIERLRVTPAGRYALRIYEQERGATSSRS